MVRYQRMVSLHSEHEDPQPLEIIPSSRVAGEVIFSTEVRLEGEEESRDLEFCVSDSVEVSTQLLVERAESEDVRGRGISFLWENLVQDFGARVVLRF